MDEFPFLRRRGFLQVVALYAKVIFLVLSAKAQDSQSLSNATSSNVHREGYCSMYGICSQRSDGKALNCPTGVPSVKPDNLFSSKIQSLCPTITGNVCCSQEQFEILRQQVQQAVPLLVGCPACLRNFLNLFCDLSCSPDQSLFINVTSIKQMQIFPYSVYYIFFEQYLNVWKTALINIAIGLGAVFLVCLVITCSLWTSATILLVLAMIVLDMMGVMAILKIQLNAVSVVNIVMSIGIAVEFCVHITHAFLVSSGDRRIRATTALGTMGASVFSGITLTKLVGVIVLRFAKSQLIVVYYFQMYLALVIIGFLHGLVFLPVLLSICGPPSRYVAVEKPENEPVSGQTSNQSN